MRSMKLILVLLSAISLSAGCNSTKSQDRKNRQSTTSTTRPKTKLLPAGFVAVEGSGVHPTGWPKEIRCTRDDSVMVFVPGGKFASGLTGKQLDALAKLIVQDDPLATEEAENRKQQIESKEQFLKILKEIKPGKMLTRKDIQDIEKLKYDQQLAISIVAEMEKQGKQIPPKDLNRWRDEGKSFAALAKIPIVQKTIGLTAEDAKWLTAHPIEEFEPLKKPEDPIKKTRRDLKECILPLFKVRLGPFYIDKYEVTNRRYKLFMAKQKDTKHLPGIHRDKYGYTFYGYRGPRKPYQLWQDRHRNRDNQPVTCVTEKDAAAYARWAGKSVPTWLQWERAAVGEGGRLFPWGSDFKPDYCRCRIEPPQPVKIDPAEEENRKPTLLDVLLIAKDVHDMIKGAVPADVGKYTHDVSPMGCYDMAGNVSEWVRAPSQSAFGRTDYVLKGGNAGSLRSGDLVPANRNMTSLIPVKLRGFRTVLLLNQAKDR